ncbi:hypothetical protein [Pseudooceanicola sp. 200-1SW]|uniref:hypothetical protein n=1 Tax=Pseudooceanicola sp. 200-1SW TaxID=3425949 RepID=UPI003D7FB6BF
MLQRGAPLKVLISGARRSRARALRRVLTPLGAEVRIDGFRSHTMLEADVVLPFSGEETCYLNTIYPEYAGVKYLLPDLAAFALCEDKGALYARLARAGFGAHLAAPVPGQAVVRKPRIGTAGVAASVLPYETMSDSPAWVWQRRLSDAHEYAGHFLIDGAGRMVLARACRYTRHENQMRHDLRDGAGALVDIPPDHRALFAAMLAEIGLRGFCCFDYFVTPEDGVQVLEINGRVGGSMVRMPEVMGPAYCRAVAPELTAHWPEPVWPQVVRHKRGLAGRLPSLRRPRFA